jgi:acyl carrier protein
MDTTPGLIDGVIEVLVSTLGIEDRQEALDASTPLLGSLPELDSMAIVVLIGAIEDHFGITIDEDDLTGEAFETVGSLAALVESQS